MTESARPAALAGGQNAVLAAIDRARAADELTEDVGPLVDAVTGCTTALALDDWLHALPRGHAVKARVCGFPLCWSPPRPADGAGGAPAVYCEQHSRGANPSQASRRERQRLHGGPPAAPPAIGDTEPDPGRPLSSAHATFTSQIAAVRADLRAVIGRFEQLEEQVATAADDDSRLVEIDTLTATHAEELAAARKATLAAQAQSRRDQDAVRRMTADMEEANNAAETAEAAAEAARAAVEQAERQRQEAVDALATGRDAFEQGLADARAGYERQLADAQARFDAELARRTTELTARAEQAAAEKETALQQAAQREQEAAQTETRAEAAIAEAHAERDRLTEELAAARTEIRELNDRIQQRDSRHEQALRDQQDAHRTELADQRRDLRAEYDRTLTPLRAEVETLRQQREQDRTAHAEALEALRVQRERDLDALRRDLAEQHRTDVAEQLQRQQASHDQAQQAAVAAVETTHTALRAADQTAHTQQTARLAHALAGLRHRAQTLAEPADRDPLRADRHAQLVDGLRQLERELRAEPDPDDAAPV